MTFTITEAGNELASRLAILKAVVVGEPSNVWLAKWAPSGMLNRDSQLRGGAEKGVIHLAKPRC